jgi:hypothetical protein
MNVVHYIGSEWNSKFIIAKTNCGKDWYKIEESTEKKEYVTCKKCLTKLK